MKDLPSHKDFDLAPPNDEERDALVSLDSGFHLRPPPAPHCLNSFITNDEDLFQTIHMGAAHVDHGRWRLVVTGLVAHSFSLTLAQLKALPSRTVTSFHECFGSPLKPATTALWRVGNVEWTGVPLKVLLGIAGILQQTSFVWSEGLDSGEFGGISADRYEKDLPIRKALENDVLVAWGMNGQPLSVERGGPVRLVVPGWFGTNSTKWLSKLTVQDKRSSSHFATTFYNERNPPDDPGCECRPVWEVQPNSLIARPRPDWKIEGPETVVEGWAWSSDEISHVRVSTDDGLSWVEAEVEPRKGFSWQRYRVAVALRTGRHTVLAQATGADGRQQPLHVGRNHVHRVVFDVA